MARTPARKCFATARGASEIKCESDDETLRAEKNSKQFDTANLKPFELIP